MKRKDERADFEAWHTEAFWNPIFDDEEDCFIPRIVQSRYEAYQAGRAALKSQAREDAEVTAYALPSGIGVERCVQRDGTYLWAVRDSFKNCLNRSGQWDYEPFPSARTDEWIGQHRFSSAAFAIDHARRIEGDGE